jgi:hypothetical protein
VWTRLPARETLESVDRVRGVRDNPAGVSATTPRSLYFASPIFGFAYMHHVALGLARCVFPVTPAL